MFDLYKEESTTTSKSIPREYKYDFVERKIALVNGSPQWVEGLEAIKIWIYKTLSSECKHIYKTRYNRRNSEW